MLFRSAFTIAFWLYVPTQTVVLGAKGVLGWGNSAFARTAAGFYWNGVVTNGLSFEFAGGNAAYPATYTFVRDKWVHVCVTKRPGVIKDTLTWYYDGVSVPLSSGSSSSTPNISAGKLAVGQWTTGDNNRAVQFLDQLAIYDRELTSSEGRYLAQGT